MKVINLISFVFLLLLNLTTAKTLSSGNGRNTVNNNRIDDDKYEYASETCELSAFPPRADTMCCGVDVTSSNRIVGGESTALNQYPWMAIIEHQIINTIITQPWCGGSLISSLYVLTAAHCVAGKTLEKRIPINVVLGDYDKFHNGPDCIISNGKKICTEGEIRIPISNIKVYPGYDDTTAYNDIALIKLSKMAPYTDAIRPICLPSQDFTKKYQKNLWLDVAGWGTMKQVKDGNIFIDYQSATKRHLRVPFISTEECQKILTIVKSNKQMCVGGLEGKNVCSGDSGGPLMFNNRGQYEVSGIISMASMEPCGREGIPSVHTNVHKYKSWIKNAIIEMEHFDNKNNDRFSPKYYPIHIGVFTSI